MHYYKQYVNHMLRFYARYCDKDLKNFKKEPDVKNWKIAERVLSELPEEDRNVIIEVYRCRNTLENNVQEVSKKLGVNRDIIWTIINKVSKKIAKEKELI